MCATSTHDAKQVSPITSRATDYAQWYLDVIAAADLIDHSPVRGCNVIKPWGMAIWDLLRSQLDNRIRASGAQNAYFPLFIPQSFFSKEADHVDGFAKECAIVTHYRLANDENGELAPDPSAVLEEPLVVRPTSETMIWHMFGRWIHSHRDLPLKINQWANVVRWELRTRPFLRTSEFLWQEGHTAHASQKEALEFSKEMLDMYAEVCKDMLAMPVVQGAKSASERFAGAEETFTIEALMQNGWALQSGTSHYLGQNFAKAFDVHFQTEDGTRELVYATSWGVSTRLLGGMIMSHADDKGLVLPPNVAPLQVIIVPIVGKSQEENDEVTRTYHTMVHALRQRGIRVDVDARQHLRPGAKYFEWERKGVPLRLEIGPRDLKKQQTIMHTRHNDVKEPVSIADLNKLVDTLSAKLSTIHETLYQQAQERTQSRTVEVTNYQQMYQVIAMQASTI